MEKSKDWNGNKKTTYVQLGASNHCDHDRQELDYYETDSIAIDRLKKVYEIPKNIIEISAGNGALSKRLKDFGHNVISWDIIQRDYPLDKVQDFLSVKEIPSDYSILTNPPFSLSSEFVLHSLQLLNEGQQAIFFLKIQFLESNKRYKQIFSQPSLKYVYVATDRIVCGMNGKFTDNNGKKISSAVCYAWFVFQKGFNGEPTIRWC